MAEQPGGQIDERKVTELALRMQQRGQAQGIPGLGNVGSQSLDHYKDIVRAVFIRARAQRRALAGGNEWLQYLGKRGRWTQARNPTGGDLPSQGGAGPGNAANSRQTGALPHFWQFRRTSGFF